MPTNFLDLSAELRIDIFRECINQRYITPMKLNKFLYSELNPELYERNDFQISIDPSIAEKGVTLFGGTEHFLPVQSEHIQQPACLLGKKVPFERFRSLHIQIHPPDSTDPGQFVRAWLQVTRMLMWLLPGSQKAFPAFRIEWAQPAINNTGLGLPPIRIEFVELEGRLWQKSLCRPDINFSNDIEYVMLAFRRIRYGQAIEIKAPKACWTFTFRWFSDVSAEATTQQVSFGSQTDDTVHQSGVDTFHILLENMLDNLEGPSAAQLRLERFANWCECYEHQHHRRRVGHKYPDRPGRFGGIYNRGVVIPMYDRCFEDRKIGFAMYNLPVAEGQQIMSLPLQDCWKLTWPQGIPTKLSEEYRAMQQSQYGHDAMIVAMAVLRGAVPPLRFRCPTCLAWRTCTGPA